MIVFLVGPLTQQMWAPRCTSRSNSGCRSLAGCSSSDDFNVHREGLLARGRGNVATELSWTLVLDTRGPMGPVSVDSTLGFALSSFVSGIQAKAETRPTYLSNCGCMQPVTDQCSIHLLHKLKKKKSWFPLSHPSSHG